MPSSNFSRTGSRIGSLFASAVVALTCTITRHGLIPAHADESSARLAAEVPTTPPLPSPPTKPSPPVPAVPPAPPTPGTVVDAVPPTTDVDALEPDVPNEAPDREAQDASKDSDRNRVISPGESFRLKRDSSVHDLVILMGKATVDGTVDGNLVVVGGKATINGTVSGSIACAGGRLVLGPSAVVQGDVAGFGHLEKRAGATILGKVALKKSPSLRDVISQTPGEWLDRMAPSSQLFFTDHVFKARPLSLRLAWPWAVLVGIVLAHALALALFPSPITRAAELVSERPVTTLLLGFIGLPLALVVALLVSGVTGCFGTPFVILAGVLGLIMGKVAIELQLGRRLLAFVGPGTAKRYDGIEPESWAPNRLWTAYALGAGLLVLGYLIPYLGFGIWALVSLWGLGAMLLMLVNRRGTATPAPTYAPSMIAPTPIAPSRNVPTPDSATSPITPKPTVAAPGTIITPAMEAPIDRTVPMTASLPTTPSTSGLSEIHPVGSGPTLSHPSESPIGSQTRTAPLIPPTGPTGPTPPPPDASSFQRELWALPRAGLGIRLLALLIDLLVIGMFSALMPSWLDRIDFAKPVGLVAYFAGFWVWKGASVGGLLMGIRVIRLDGRPIDWPVAIVRSLASFLSLFSAGLGQFWCAWDVDQQTWQDKLAGTVVVKEERMRSLI